MIKIKGFMTYVIIESLPAQTSDYMLLIFNVNGIFHLNMRSFLYHKFGLLLDRKKKTARDGRMICQGKVKIKRYDFHLLDNVISIAINLGSPLLIFRMCASMHSSIELDISYRYGVRH